MKNQKQTFMIKGIYTHAQIHGYFTVKEYIMLEQEGKHCLLVRFENEMNITVNEMDFVVKQYNAAGKLLGKVKIHYSDLEIKSGELYCTEQGIVINEECVDCVVQIKYLIGDNVKYVFKKGWVTEHYDPRGYEQRAHVHPRKSHVTVRRKNMGEGKYFNWIAFLSFVLTLAFVALFIYQSRDIYGSQTLFDESVQSFLQSI